MVRALTIIALLFGLALLSVWLVENPGRITFQWLGYEGESAFTLLVVVLAALQLLVFFLFRAGFWLVGAARRMHRHLRAREERKGLDNLVKGLVAAAAGDAEAAKRFAAGSKGTPQDETLTLLLRAQTVSLAGDGPEADREAESVYRAMLKKPLTELLGLQGLIRLLRKKGKLEEALELAERAFDQAPHARWAFEDAFSLETQARDWDAALESVDLAKSGRLLTPGEVKRRKAVLYLMEGQEERAHGHSSKALSLGQKALGLAPDLVPAAIMVADIYQNTDRPKRAAHTIEEIWPKAPHPALGRIYVALGEDGDAEAAWRRVRGLCELNKPHPESRILFARLAVEAGKWLAARDALYPLAEERTPTARVAELMAKIEEGETKNRKAADAWQAAAAHAPRDALWSCTNCGRQTGGWSAVCAGCGAFDAQVWKASDDFAAALVDEREDEALGEAAAPKAGYADDAPQAEHSGERDQPAAAKKEPREPVTAVTPDAIATETQAGTKSDQALATSKAPAANQAAKTSGETLARPAAEQPATKAAASSSGDAPAPKTPQKAAAPAPQPQSRPQSRPQNRPPKRKRGTRPAKGTFDLPRRPDDPGPGGERFEDDARGW